MNKSTPQPTVVAPPYNLTVDQKKYYASVLLLEDMCNFGRTLSVLLEGDDKLLEPLFIHMMSKDWVEVKNEHYVPTSDGRKLVKNYLERLTEFRSAYKVYSGVDTGEGIFAYTKYFDFDTDAQFEDYINQDNFEDLRVAVCEFKNINPLDMIFLELVDEGRFDFEIKGWQGELVTGLIWDELLEIANSNLSLSNLDEDGTTGREVMEIIIKRGTDLMLDLIQQQDQFDDEESESGDYDDDDEGETYVETTVEYVVEEPVFEYDYYESYYDPYYVSPCWGVYWY